MYYILVVVSLSSMAFTPRQEVT